MKTALGSHCHRSYACLAGAKRRGVRCCCLGRQFPAARLSLLYTKLVRPGKLDLATVITRLTTGPAQILGLDQAGTLKPGSPADITVINLEATAAIGALSSRPANVTPLPG